MNYFLPSGDVICPFAIESGDFEFTGQFLRNIIGVIVRLFCHTFLGPTMSVFPGGRNRKTLPHHSELVSSFLPFLGSITLS